MGLGLGTESGIQARTVDLEEQMNWVELSGLHRVELVSWLSFPVKYEGKQGLFISALRVSKENCIPYYKWKWATEACEHVPKTLVRVEGDSGMGLMALPAERQSVLQIMGKESSDGQNLVCVWKRNSVLMDGIVLRRSSGYPANWVCL